MKNLFGDLLSIEDVDGAMLLSHEGDQLFQEFGSGLKHSEGNEGWLPFIQSLNDAREVELVFEKGRAYLRKTDLGYVLVLTGQYVSMAMVRLNCDILLPELKLESQAGGRRRGFFRKKR